MKLFIGERDGEVVLLPSREYGARSGFARVAPLDAYCSVDSELSAVYRLYVQAVATRRHWRGVRWVGATDVGGLELSRLPDADHQTSLPLFAAGYAVGSLAEILLREGMNRRERGVYEAIRKEVGDGAI